MEYPYILSALFINDDEKTYVINNIVDYKKAMTKIFLKASEDFNDIIFNEIKERAENHPVHLSPIEHLVYNSNDDEIKRSDAYKQVVKNVERMHDAYEKSYANAKRLRDAISRVKNNNGNNWWNVNDEDENHIASTLVNDLIDDDTCYNNIELLQLIDGLRIAFTPIDSLER